jgi:hypothetical protein
MENEERGARAEKARSISPDPAVLREALAEYRAWNEAVFVDKVRNAGKKSHAEKWREYRSLYSFARKTKPELSPLGQVMAAQEWTYYYEQVQRFADRSRSGG